MSAGNPYDPPGVDVNAGGGFGAAGPEARPDAGLGARLVNFVIDNVLIIVVGSIAAAVVALLGGDMASETTSTVVGCGTVFVYYLVLEAAFGWTVGKLVSGTRVVTVDGRKPHLGHVIGRTLARFLPFEPLSLVFGRGSSAWHDSIVGTRVVKVRVVAPLSTE